MTVKAEQTNEHDDKQGDICEKPDGYCHFGVLAGGERLACVHITKLSERLAQNAEYKCFLFTRKIPDTKPDRRSAPDCPKSEDLPWMKNAQLFIHMMAAIPTATIFLFQMATLMASINAYFWRRGP